WVVNDFAHGIRRQPYSTNPAVFTRTFGSIRDSAEVHDVGEIWCNTLWKLHAAMVTKYGYAAARYRALQLLVDADKLAPSDPTFLDMRDAILLADQQRYANADYADIWKVFASMGMGVVARTTGIDDTRPDESFNLPPNRTGFVYTYQAHYLPGEDIEL